MSTSEDHQPHHQVSLARLPNVVPFLIFRVFFNLRFYYPVFALLFLDFGLTLSQFSISNLVWALAIVALEVPSGALADIVGRKKLVVSAACFMLCEMGVLLWARPHSGDILLLWFCLNRLLSGAGEAMASGADEALVYDALTEAGQEKRWSEVLEWQSRLTSLAFFVAMLVGAAVYDPKVLNRLMGTALTAQQTLKFPIWLTLGSGVLALVGALSFAPDKLPENDVNPWGQVKKAAARVRRSRAMLSVILAAVLFDQAGRAAMTLSAQTYAAFGIEKGWFGVIGAVLGLSGLFVSGLAKRLAEEATESVNFWLLVGLSLIGLAGQALSRGAYGLLFVFVLSCAMSFLGYFSSFYLNRLAPSKDRATILSFKGLVCNLGFGAVSLYYSLVSAHWPHVESHHGYLSSLLSLVVYFVVCLLLYGLFRAWSGRASGLNDQAPNEHESP